MNYVALTCSRQSPVAQLVDERRSDEQVYGVRAIERIKEFTQYSPRLNRRLRRCRRFRGGGMELSILYALCNLLTLTQGRCL